MDDDKISWGKKHMFDTRSRLHSTPRGECADPDFDENYSHFYE